MPKPDKEDHATVVASLASLIDEFADLLEGSEKKLGIPTGYIVGLRDESYQGLGASAIEASAQLKFPRCSR